MTTNFFFLSAGRFLKIHSTLMLFVLVVAIPAHGAIRIWTGGGANNFWNNSANWGGSALAAGDDLVFQGGGAVDATSLLNTNNFSTNTAFRSITFTGTNYVLRGNPIVFANTGTVAISGQNGGGINTVVLALRLDAGQTFDCTLAGGTLVASGTINLNGNSITNNTTGRIRLQGIISGTGHIVKNNNGTMNIEGAGGANTFSGQTRVNAGTLELGKSTAVRECIVGDGVGADTVRFLSANAIGFFPVLVNTNAVLDLNGFNDISAGIGQLELRGGTVTTGAGILRINGTLTTQASAVQSSISGNLDLGGTTRTFSIANGAAIRDLVISAVITNGGISKTGVGFVELSGANTYTGVTTINAGILDAANNSALGTTNGGTVVNGGTLGIFVSHIGLEDLSLTGVGTGNGAISAAGPCAWDGNVTLAGATTIDVSVLGELQLLGSIGGTGDLRKDGPGTLTFGGSSSNTYVGNTFVDSGILKLAKVFGNFAIPGGRFVIGDGVGGANADVVQLENDEQIADTVPVTVNNSGFFNLQFYDETIGSLTGNGNVDMATSPPFMGDLFTGGDNSSTTFNGVISGAGGQLWKLGIGTFTLAGNNTYGGTTEVQGGTLLVNGSQPQSQVNIIAGAALGGSGTVGIINSVGGGIAPGSSPGILTSSNVVLNASSTFSVEINGPTPGTGYDQLNVRGTNLLTGSTLSVTVGGGLPLVEGQPLTLLNNDNAEIIGGTFSGLPEGSVFTVGSMKFKISYIGGTGNDVTLTLTNPPLKGVAAAVAAGNGNNAIDPNECNHLYLTITNNSGVPISGISATLSTTTPHVIITQPGSAFTDIPTGGKGTNVTPFQISTLPLFPCASNIDLLLTVNSSVGNFVSTFTLPTGFTGSPAQFSNDVLLTIPDATFVTSTNTVAGVSGPIAKVTVSLYLTHPNDGDLDLRLIGPDGTSVALSSFNGGTGDDYGSDCVPASRTTFDDAAATAITAGSPPYVGTFRPQGSLAAFNGKSGFDVNGNWRLQIEDDVLGGPAGTLRCWTLSITPTECADGGGFCDTCPGFITNSIAAGDLTANDRLSRFTGTSMCSAPKACSGGVGGFDAPVHYDTYTFTNAAGPTCVTVYIESPCGLFAAAYLDAYDPTNLCNNYLADLDDSPTFGSFSFKVPGGTSFIVVVNEIPSAGGGCDYTLVVTGTDCRPDLNIAPALGNQARLFWPTFAAGYLLDSTPSLVPTNWTVVTNQPIVVGPDFNVTNSVGASNQFYRLRKP